MAGYRLSAFEALKEGDAITVLMPYQGQGRFAADGCEGRWFVLRKMANGDFKAHRRPTDDDGRYVFIHASRVLETTAYTDHPEQHSAAE